MHFLSRNSLTQRLTLLFVAAASAVLLLLGLVVASSVEQHFEDLDMEVLSGKMELTRQALERVTPADGLVEFTHQLANSLVGHHGLEMMVIDPEHTLIFATANAGFNPERVIGLALEAPSRPVLWELEGQSYRVLAAHLPTATKDQQQQTARVFVAVATNIAHHQRYMRSFLLTLWLFVVCAAGLIGLLGWFAVRRGLAPLHSMRRQAQVVTAQQLGNRLEVQRMPVELAELAQSLNDMLARLEVAFARLSDFSCDIAHELRTPVSNLMTETQVALARTRDAAQYRSVLESNAEELEHMARMISDMLLLARSDNGLAVPAATTVNLGAEVAALFDYYEAVAEEKGLQLVLHGDGTALADRLLLRRALGNLLSNAIRHSSPNSSILVSIDAQPPMTSISIENSGAEIPTEYLHRVFDRFFRVDPSRHRGEGAGLGLAIAKSIVLAHGGTITVTSHQGITRFTIKLIATEEDNI